jgi:hypothetical protein
MKTIDLCFDISATRFNAYQADRFRKDLSNNLDNALQKAGIGQCLKSRNRFNNIKLVVKANTYKEAIQLIDSEIQNPEWFPNMTCTKKNAEVEVPAS